MFTAGYRYLKSVPRLLRYGWIGLFLLLTACHVDMYDQPKFKTYEPSSFFADTRSSRKPVDGTVPSLIPVGGTLPAGQATTDKDLYASVAKDGTTTDAHLYTGMVNGTLVDTMPFPVTEKVLLRGQEQFTVFCVPCHGRLGNGKGVVSLRGGVVAANFHDQRLVNMPIGHFFVVMTNGYRYMFSYASRIQPEDRWAIAAYIRALQLSQNATLADVPQDKLQDLEGQP